MKKIKHIKSIIIIVIIVIITFVTSMLNSNRITLIINNKTNKNIDLKLNYTGLKKDITIPTIKSNDNIKYKVYIGKDFKEGSLSIYYTDENNKKVKFVVVGYFEKEYKDTINISIKEINDKIEITTKR